ncbi:MAG TPA: hypothetical protein VH852_04255 [Hyphomicrobium sp.]|jgi:hypothetical protein
MKLKLAVTALTAFLILGLTISATVLAPSAAVAEGDDGTGGGGGETGGDGTGGGSGETGGDGTGGGPGGN